MLLLRQKLKVRGSLNITRVPLWDPFFIQFFIGDYMFDLSLLVSVKAIKRTAAKASGVIAIAIKKSIAIKSRKQESFFKV